MSEETVQVEWNSDEELFALIRKELYTPVVGDILDGLGEYHRFLPQPIQPMKEHMVVIGRAMPVRFHDVDGPQEKPFGYLTESLDDLKPGEVYVGTGGSCRCAYWGEILTAASRRCKAVGAVINGFHRDTPKVLEQDWPVFTRGRYAQDSSVRLAVQAYRVPIEMDGVWIEPGDLVFGDLDGVLIVPKALEQQTITLALEKARAEKTVRESIENGMSATEAFHKYGVL